MVELLLEDDKLKSTRKLAHAENKFGNVGAIINIILSSITVFPFVILCIVFLSYGLGGAAIIFLSMTIGPISSIVSNIRYKNGKNNRTAAAVLGILFSGFIGGIFVLLGKDNPNSESKSVEKKFHKTK